MKALIIFLTLVTFSFLCISQETVTDFDGNTYNTVTIGTQIWFQENLRSTHYSDGTIIPGAVTYENNESLASTYGRLYTWNAAMKNSTQQMAQGACPDGWHVASAEEWLTLENYLGGSTVAGGKMKTTTNWKSPNTGASNSSKLSVLPGGEYDAHYSPNVFRLFSEYAVIWTSTEINSEKAREKYLTFESARCFIYDWYKVMKYSVRCIKNTSTSEASYPQEQVKIFPTLVENTLRISSIYSNQEIQIRIVNMVGNTILLEKSSEQEFSLDLSQLPSGAYLVHVILDKKVYSQKIIKSL